MNSFAFYTSRIYFLLTYSTYEFKEIKYSDHAVACSSRDQDAPGRPTGLRAYVAPIVSHQHDTVLPAG